MSSTPTQPQPPSGPPPVPPTKPVLSSPGAYIANFSTTPTAGIHSSNKTSEKPAIAARPIPPPTLPKYSASFNKADRDTTPMIGKIDRIERDKVGTWFDDIYLFFDVENFWHCLIIWLQCNTLDPQYIAAYNTCGLIPQHVQIHTIIDTFFDVKGGF